MTNTQSIPDLADRYLDDIGRYPVMTAKEFDRLIPLAQAGDRDAINWIVQGNLRFVVQVASDYTSSALPFADLVAEGNIGLIKAVSRFNPGLGYRFSTYAVWWIRNAIQRAIRRHTHAYRMPHNRLDDLSRIQRSSRLLSQQLGREVSFEEGAEALGMNAKRARLALDARRTPASIDEPIDGDGPSLQAMLPDPAALPDEDLFQQEISGKVEKALRNLGGREAEVIRLSFGFDDEPLTLAEVGARYGISKERVRQIRNRAMGRLRTMLLGERALGSAL